MDLCRSTFYIQEIDPRRQIDKLTFFFPSGALSVPKKVRLQAAITKQGGRGRTDCYLQEYKKSGRSRYPEISALPILSQTKRTDTTALWKVIRFVWKRHIYAMYCRQGNADMNETKSSLEHSVLLFPTMDPVMQYDD